MIIIFIIEFSIYLIIKKIHLLIGCARLRIQIHIPILEFIQNFLFIIILTWNMFFSFPFSNVYWWFNAVFDSFSPACCCFLYEGSIENVYYMRIYAILFSFKLNVFLYLYENKVFFVPYNFWRCIVFRINFVLFYAWVGFSEMSINWNGFFY